MGQLASLSGTDGKPRDVEFFRSITRALFLLSRDKCATTAGDNGAINIWVDDDGRYRGCRMRWMITEAETIVDTKRKLKEWLTKEIPLIRAGAALERKEGGE